jgi:hypothetical protein
VRTERVSGGVIGAALVGIASGIKDNWVETGNRPTYEQCMTENGFGEKALAERPEGYVSPKKE